MTIIQDLRSDGLVQYYPATHEYPQLDADQERTLGQIMLAGRRTAAALRFPVIDLAPLSTLSVHAALAAISRRSRPHQLRAAAQWVGRGGNPAAVRAALSELATELESVSMEMAVRVADLARSEDAPYLLVASVRLEHDLIGRLRAGDAAAAFLEVIERQVSDLDERMGVGPLQSIELTEASRLARSTLIESNLRLALKRARQVMRRSRLPFADLVQSANEGLVHAVDAYDVRHEVRFREYGYRWIKQRVRRAERHASMLPLSVHIDAQKFKVLRAARHLEASAPLNMAEAVSKKLRVPEGVVATILLAETTILSLEGDAATSARSLPDTANPIDFDLEAKELRRVVTSALSTCGARERTVVAAFFGIGEPPRSIAEIARSTGLSTQRIYQIKTDALRKLRRPAIARTLAEYAA